MNPTTLLGQAEGGPAGATETLVDVEITSIVVVEVALIVVVIVC